MTRSETTVLPQGPNKFQLIRRYHRWRRNRRERLLTAGKTIDYREMHWGHTILDWDVRSDRVRASGFGPLFGWRIEPGDFVLVRMKRTGVQRWQFTEIAYDCDPRDLWCGTLRHVPEEAA